MHILILYDSVFGNTRRIALEMQEAVKDPHTVTVTEPEAFSVDSLRGVDLLIAGSPTRAFRPTKPIVTALRRLPREALSPGVRTAAFDTRVSLEEVDSKVLDVMVSLFGYAAQPLDTLLRKKGGLPLVSPAWFYVEGKEGPLRTGEVERASAWMIDMISRLVST